METDIHTHVVLVVGIVKKGSKYLFAKRQPADPQAGGQWSFPGGKVDAEIGEGIIEATLRREIKEEVGLEIKDGLRYLGSQSFVRVSGHNVVALTFLCDYKSGVAAPLDGQSEVSWYTLSEARSLPLPPYTLSRLKYLQ